MLENVRRSKSFRKEKTKLHDERKAILAYLFTAANNKFNDFYNKQKRNEIPLKSYFDDIKEELNAVIDPRDLTKKKDLAEFIMKKLTAGEQAVVLKDLDHKHYQKYLPDEVTVELSESLKVKPSTIRKIRERAIKKINKAIDEINQS